MTLGEKHYDCSARTAHTVHFNRSAEVSWADAPKSSTDETSRVAWTRTDGLIGLAAGLQETLTGLIRLNESPRGPVHTQLRNYRRWTTQLLNVYWKQVDMINQMGQMLNQLRGEGATLQRKRWTADEDDLLVEAATQTETPDVLDLAVTFHRSPAAIASRLTYLVGKRKLSQAVVGHITGYLDGDPVEGHFDGVVTAETS